MTFSATVLYVAIASPSDLMEERKTVRETIYEWNSRYANDYKVIFLPKMWEYDSVPDLRIRAQSSLNEQIILSSDALIALFWTRFGSPTGVFESGTLEEIEEFLKTKKPIALYFSERLSSPSKIDPIQLTALQGFRSKLTGLYGTFLEIPDLVDKVQKFLTKTALELNNSDSSKQYEEHLLQNQNNTVQKENKVFTKFMNESLSANADGHWLSIICDYGKGYEKFNSKAKDLVIDWAKKLAFNIYGSDLSFSCPVGKDLIRVTTSENGTSSSKFNLLYHNDGVLKIQWRGDGEEINLAWVLVRLIITLRELISSPAVENGSPLQVGLALSHAPQFGIVTQSVFDSTPTLTDFRYLNSSWNTDFGKPIDIDKTIREFLYSTLNNWGYKYFEDALEKYQFSESLQTLKAIEAQLEL